MPVPSCWWFGCVRLVKRELPCRVGCLVRMPSTIRWIDSAMNGSTWLCPSGECRSCAAPFPILFPNLSVGDHGPASSRSALVTLLGESIAAGEGRVTPPGSQLLLTLSCMNKVETLILELKSAASPDRISGRSKGPSPISPGGRWLVIACIEFSSRFPFRLRKPTTKPHSTVPHSTVPLWGVFGRM